MKKESFRGIFIIFYPFFLITLFIKTYFIWIVLVLLGCGFAWFALENYRAYTQGRGEYTSYLPSLFRKDKEGDSTALNYMDFDLEKAKRLATSPAPMAVPSALSKPVAAPAPASVPATPVKVDPQSVDVQKTSEVPEVTKKKSAVPVVPIQSEVRDYSDEASPDFEPLGIKEDQGPRSSIQEEARARLKKMQQPKTGKTKKALEK